MKMGKIRTRIIVYMKSKTRKRKGGAAITNPPKNVILSNIISFSANTESEYKSVGVAHVTESAGVNVLRDIGTELFNILGQKGFQSSVHDYCREKALEKLMSLLTSSNQKLCDVKLDVETNKQTILIHAYGTIYEKK
jgi:hypothetical protein